MDHYQNNNGYYGYYYNGNTQLKNDWILIGMTSLLSIILTVMICSLCVIGIVFTGWILHKLRMRELQSSSVSNESNERVKYHQYVAHSQESV